MFDAIPWIIFMSEAAFTRALDMSFSSLTVFILHLPGLECLASMQLSEFAGNCGPFSARAMGFLGSFSLAHVFPGLLVCTV